jgi:hypothetical protein
LIIKSVSILTILVRREIFFDRFPSISGVVVLIRRHRSWRSHRGLRSSSAVGLLFFYELRLFADVLDKSGWPQISVLIKKRSWVHVLELSIVVTVL